MNPSLVEYLNYTDEISDLEEYESKSSISELTAQRQSSCSNQEGVPSSASSQLATVIANILPRHWTAKDVLTTEPDPVAECRFLKFPVVRLEDDECSLQPRRPRKVNVTFQNAVEEKRPCEGINNTSGVPDYQAIQNCAASGDAPVASVAGELKSAAGNPVLAGRTNTSWRSRVLSHLRRLNCGRRRNLE